MAEQPDIMGDLREEIEAFYKRDHVEVVEETDLVETMFFTDLNFSWTKRWGKLRLNFLGLNPSQKNVSLASVTNAQPRHWVYKPFTATENQTQLNLPH